MTEPRTLTFFAEGTPAPEGSHRSFWSEKQRRVVTVHEGAEALEAWRDMIAARAALPVKRAGGTFPKQEAVSVTVTFVVRRPASATRPFPSVRPDLDKLARAVLDALTSANAWADDEQVVHLDTYEVYGRRTGAAITVTNVIPPAPHPYE